MIIYTHVKFEGGYPRVANWVPLAEAPAYYLANQTHHIEWVRWHTDDDARPRESFGKQWMTWTGEKWELAGIGAGTYSGMNVVQYHEVQKRAAKRT
jgi:hypothetical protein